MSGTVFIDWITVAQDHPQGGLPIIQRGLSAHFDRYGNCIIERVKPETVSGSFETGVRVSCDGYRVYLTGNVGRLGRSDNLFNHGWEGTKGCLDRICARADLPPFRAAQGLPFSPGEERISGARIYRLDVTGNFACGSDGQARALIRWIAARSVARVKKGSAGDESVWWANTRRMFKAYVKAAEMRSHGVSEQDWLYRWTLDQGVARVEVELKRRLLEELGLNDFGAVTDARLAEVFASETELLRSVDRSDEPDILAALPKRSRAIAAAWLAGVDPKTFVGRSQLYVHARVLRGYGIDLFAERSNVKNFPVRVRVIDFEPMRVPDWYDLKEDAA